jgi:hypothetical protein
MIDRILNHACNNFMSTLAIYRPTNDSTGISQHLIAGWMENNIEVVNSVMPVIGWKKLELAGDVYWFEPAAYEKFRQRIEEYLIRDVVYEVCD